MGKELLVVLETHETKEGDKKALLFNPSDALQPYLVAYGFNAEGMSWDECNLHYTVEGALSEFKREYFIQGLTPESIINAWGDEYHITPAAATEVACAVNEEVEESLRQSVNAESVRSYVEDICPRIEDQVRHECESMSSHAQALVSGTMYLDVNGYDYMSALDAERGTAKSTGGSYQTTEQFVTLAYSTVLVEEAMAKEGIPLTQPNVAFMSDKIARALRQDAQDNASYIAADTAAYWKASCPDCGQRMSPSRSAVEASAVSRGVCSAEGEDQARVVARSR